MPALRHRFGTGRAYGDATKTASFFRGKRHYRDTARNMLWRAVMSPRIALRRFAGLLLAAALAGPGTLAAAEQRSAHQPCKAQGHPCGHVAVMSHCCCHSDDSGQPASPQSPFGRIQLSGPDHAAWPALLSALPTSTAALSAAALASHSPRHGYHSTALSILYSTFLI